MPKSLVIWASPVTLTLTQTAEVLLEEDAYITRVWEWGCPKRGDETPETPLRESEVGFTLCKELSKIRHTATFNTLSVLYTLGFND